METAKVDIEKLQLLNDRINQTIEALNQVRLSVHGLQSARTGQNPGVQFGGIGLSHSGIGGQIPGQQTPWAQQAFGQPFSPQFGQQNPWVQQQNPWLQQAYQQGIGGMGTGGYGQGYGLSHSGFDPYRQASVDPMGYARLVQTFPFLVADPVMGRQF